MQKRPILRLHADAAAKIPLATIEFRVLWNETKAEWEIQRNGTDIESPRRKRQSAIDLAVRAARAEKAKTQAKVIVTTMDGRKAKTEWTSDASAGRGNLPK